MPVQVLTLQQQLAFLQGPESPLLDAAHPAPLHAIPPIPAPAPATSPVPVPNLPLVSMAGGGGVTAQAYSDLQPDEGLQSGRSSTAHSSPGDTSGGGSQRGTQG